MTGHGPAVDALAVGGPLLVLAMGLAALLHREISERNDRRRRVQVALGAAVGRDAGRRDGRAEKAKRRQIELTLREMAAKQKALAQRDSRVTLATRIRQAGLGWTRGGYIAACFASGVLGFLASAAFLGLGLLPAGGFGVALGLLAPHLYVGLRRNRRMRVFVSEMPDALDVIVRGVRSGLPLGDCLRIIAAEGREPLRGEFRQLVEDMAIGLTVAEAGDRMYERIPILEVKLLGIILNIQNKSGGNLSEAIGNLSRVLRDRKKMKAKVKAISTEATASAAIIGALPVLVAGLLYLTTPDYIALLFTTQIGNIALAAGGVWMSIGVLVMRSMINFNI